MAKLASCVSDFLIPFLGYTIAPDLRSLAETCKAASAQCRKIYCKHCGKIFNSQWDNNYYIMNGRAAHIDTCEWLPEMDPFRFYYPVINWQYAFISGGWAAWLHFREHRNYINPWRKYGPMIRDLDVFFFGSGPSTGSAYYEICFSQNDDLWNGLKIIQVVKSPSVFDVRLQRYDTSNDASATLILSHISKPTHHFKIDLVGEYIHKPNEWSILELFDQPCCRVGFKVDDAGKKIWFLHPTHKHRLQFPDEDNQREKNRHHKYIARGYARLDCVCDDDVYSPYPKKKKTAKKITPN